MKNCCSRRRKKNTKFLQQPWQPPTCRLCWEQRTHQVLATEALLTVDWSRIVWNHGVCISLLFSFVNNNSPSMFTIIFIDFCTNKDKEPVSLLSSTSLCLFMVHRQHASEMDSYWNSYWDSYWEKKSDWELFWSIPSTLSLYVSKYWFTQQNTSKNHIHFTSMVSLNGVFFNIESQ